MSAIRPPRPLDRGHSLAECLVVLAIFSYVVALAMPAATQSLKRLRLRGASREMAMVFRRARTEAILGRQNVGIVFSAADGYSYSYHRDGNGNGIRAADIRSGVDPRLSGPFRLRDRYPGVDVRIAPPGPIPEIPPERGTLANLADPVKFGPTDIISFSPGGSCTPGTLYLSYGNYRMAGVRLLGHSARARLWEYDPIGRSWRER